MSGGAMRILITSPSNWGIAPDFESHILKRFSLTTFNAGHWRRRCWRSPFTWWQVPARQVPARQYPCLLSDQNLHRLSVLYLPLIILANMVDLLTSKELLPAANHSGCGLPSWCILGLKWLREDRGRASSARRVCQYSVIFCFTRIFRFSFGGGLCSSCRGWGSPYWRQSSRICTNQDLENPSLWSSAWLACRPPQSTGSGILIPRHIVKTKWTGRHIWLKITLFFVAKFIWALKGTIDYSPLDMCLQKKSETYALRCSLLSQLINILMWLAGTLKDWNVPALSRFM